MNSLVSRTSMSKLSRPVAPSHSCTSTRFCDCDSRCRLPCGRLLAGIVFSPVLVTSPLASTLPSWLISQTWLSVMPSERRLNLKTSVLQMPRPRRQSLRPRNRELLVRVLGHVAISASVHSHVGDCFSGEFTAKIRGFAPDTPVSTQIQELKELRKSLASELSEVGLAGPAPMAVE